MRGFACIGLVNPKSLANMGGALRAAGCYEASLVAISGPRPARISRMVTDTMKAYRSIPTQLVDDVFDALPYDCVPIAVDILPGALPLPEYRHPERAFYIFGAEDATLGKAITSRCRDAIIVPTSYCMNLAATVNVVLYDRLAKQSQGNGAKHNGRSDYLGDASETVRTEGDALGPHLSSIVRGRACRDELAGAA